MADPEEMLTFKLKRNQFNHRIPVQLINMFDEFGDDKKYLLEYIIWIVCKHLGTRYSSLPEWEAAMLETYFGTIKDVLKSNAVLRNEFGTLIQMEQDLEARMQDVLRKRAAEFATREQQDK